MSLKPVIFGCSGESLTRDEISFFKEANPFGYILFQRNVSNPDQLKRLTGEIRNISNDPNVPIFVDKEGGRVTRLKPPYWPALPSMRTLGEMYEDDPHSAFNAIRLHSLITAYRLITHGINGNCAPVLDLKVEGANDVIGDRAFSHNPMHVVACARVVIETFMSCGVFPVVKHMPGHGRGKVDPHDTLPIIDAERSLLEAEDFVPFKELNDVPMAMSCHVVFKELDPDAPVTLSKKVHKEVIRDQIGFNGLIFTDDLGMGAMSIPMEERGRAAIEAGADIALHCSGNLGHMEKLASKLPDMKPETKVRWDKAQTHIEEAKSHNDGDLTSMEEEFMALVG